MKKKKGNLTYSQLLPSGHAAITDNSPIRTDATSPQPSETKIGSFTNDDGDAEHDALKEMDLYFTFECRNCVYLLSNINI